MKDYILRPKYLKQIEDFIDKPVIKVLTGMRRVGKSTLLNIIQDVFLSEVPDRNKVYINFESLEYIHLNDAKSLAQHLQEKLIDVEGKVYFFFDEIQLIKDWERVINGLRVDMECDIYLTGSNSNLLSNDLATLLAGRYITLEVHPFTFDEFIEIFKDKKIKIEELFDHYLRLGGMPPLKYFDLEEEPSHKYLLDAYNTVLVKDVLQYNKIRDVDVFQRILLFAIENIGSTFSALSLHKYLKSEFREVSVDTILSYLDYCQRAYILKKVPRYDALGKKLLKIDEKYFLSDHGFREAMGFSNIKSIEKTLENIIYTELLSRGYELQIGRVKNYEIDFIARKGNQMEYYQVAYLLESTETRDREFGVFRDIQDNFPKYVLSMDQLNFSQDGINHKNIIDFLMDKK